MTEANNRLDKLNELERRQIKQECYNRRSNIKFLGLKDDDLESPKHTERLLTNSPQNEMKIRSKVLVEIQY